MHPSSLSLSLSRSHEWENRRAWEPALWRGTRCRGRLCAAALHSGAEETRRRGEEGCTDTSPRDKGWRLKRDGFGLLRGREGREREGRGLILMKTAINFCGERKLHNHFSSFQGERKTSPLDLPLLPHSPRMNDKCFFVQKRESGKRKCT